MTEEVGRKREIHNGSEMAGGRRTSRKITQTDCIDEQMDDLLKEADEVHMTRLVAKWNAENPDATPLVLEALTEQRRAALLQEDLAREVVLGEAYAVRMLEEETARAEAEEEERDPNQDDDDRDYQEYIEHWKWKAAKEFGSFEDRSKFISLVDALITSISMVSVLL